jgi:hypothetical protein
MNPGAGQAPVGQPAQMQTVAEQLENAQSETDGATPAFGQAPPLDSSQTAVPPFPNATQAQSFNPGFAQPQPQPEKKRMPAWAIALIAGGIALVLAFCCCIAILAFSEDFWERFEEGFNAASTQRDDLVITELPPILNDDNDNTVDISADSATLIQDFIDEHYDELQEASVPLLSTMGDGASVEFAADDYEFIYIYHYGDFPSEGLVGILELVLDASDGIYAMLADELARDIGLDRLTVTVRYYQDGRYLISESFESR